MKKPLPIIKFICVTCTILFDFTLIGNLHNTVENGFFLSFFINITIDILLDINVKFQIFPKMIHKFLNRMTNKDEPFKVSDLEKIYISFSIESEAYSIFVYFFLITFKYFNYTQNQLTDCFGKPLLSEIVINNNHFYLCLIMILNVVLKYFFIRLIEKILRKIITIEDGHFPKLENKWFIFSYLVNLISLTALYGYLGLYSILKIKIT